MGRNDSVGAVLASNASFSASLEWIPGRTFGINHGILRDIKLSGSISAVSEDTTGRKLYFPEVLPSGLRDVSSGTLSWTGNLEWTHPSGATLAYKPSASYDKKLSSIEYYESLFHHEIAGSYRLNENHYVGAEAFMEDVGLQAELPVAFDHRHRPPGASSTPTSGKPTCVWVTRTPSALTGTCASRQSRWRPATMRCRTR